MVEMVVEVKMIHILVCHMEIFMNQIILEVLVEGPRIKQVSLHETVFCLLS